MPIVYILTLVLLATTSHQCSPSLYSLNLTTDVIQFTSSDISAGGYNFTFRNAFSTTPQVALAITQLSTSSQKSLTNPQFYVSSQSVTTKGLQIIRNSQGQAWLIFSICLWASTNTQLLLGSFPILNSKPTSGSISLQFQILIGSSLPVNNNQICRGFLNGINSRGQLATLTIASTVYSQGRITVNINVQAGEVNIVWVSFVVFNLNNREFAAYGAYTPIASNSSQVVDLLKGFSDTQNLFYGISALQVDPMFNGLNVQMDINSNFLLGYTSQMGSFIVSYLFVGYPANFTCLACKPINNMNYYLKGQCVNQCDGNTVPITLPNGGLMCRPCPAETGLIAINGKCTCPAYYIFQGSKCIPNPKLIPGLIVQSANPIAVKPASQSLGVVNIQPNGNINQNMDFTSSPKSNSTVTTSTSTFIPSTESQLSSPPTSLIKTQTTTKTTYQSTSFFIPSVSCPLPNTFFNGHECVCNVGYVFSNGNCIIVQHNPIFIPISPTVPINKTQQCQTHAFFNGSACVCINSYYLINNNCIQCPANTQWNGIQCICIQGFSLLHGRCIKKVTCPINAQDNGLGNCVCVKDYTMVNNTCQLIRSTCPANSSVVGGVCVCNAGLFNVSGACLRCPFGAFWSSQAQRCIFICGINSFYNQTVGSCVCMQGFGKDSSGNCAVCGNNFYLLNGYCATCPINSIYNSTTKQCSCQIGFIVSQQGICLPKCGFSQVYNPLNTFCDCAANFSRVGITCVPCSTNSYFAHGQCISCPANSYIINKKCVCNTGYAADAYGMCQICSSFPNAFMMNGFCVTCTSNQIYNKSLGTCQCPFGKSWNGKICLSSCNNDELLDKAGNCYTCGMNEIISQGQCVCQPGFIRGSCGNCILSCPSGSFAFMGTCGMCPLKMNYLSQIGGCVCPNGYYMDPITDTCALSNLILPNCANGNYYDSNMQKCQPCANYCATCTSSSVCTTCAKGFTLNGNVCLPICGDGIILGSESCDSGSVNQVGCVNCQIAFGFACLGQPSSCSPIRLTPVTPNTTTPQTPKLVLKGNISLNSNNIFLTLQTTPTFTFPNPNVMQNFMQATYYNTIRPSTYCVQQPSPYLNNFDCLLIYPSGIPNTKFNVLFYFNYQGQAANVTLSIDPLLYTTSSRTAQPLPTRSSQ